MWSMTLCEGESNIFLLNSDAMIHTISQFCPEGSWHWSPHLFKSKRNSCWDRARSTSIISIKIFLVVLIVDSFSEALLSTSPGRTVPANVQITATQLFFHYRLCKTNYYYHYYYYYYFYHCYYFHYYYYYSIIESAKLIIISSYETAVQEVCFCKSKFVVKKPFKCYCHKTMLSWGFILCKNQNLHLWW